MKKILSSFLFPLVATQPYFADHGPGTTGATGSVIQPDTIEQHHFALSLQQTLTQYTEYPDVAISDATQKMKAAGSHIDTLGMGSLSNATLGYGILSWLDISATMGYYYSRRLREGILDSNTAYKLIDAGDIAGQTDLWLNTKAKLVSSPTWSFSVLAGAKLPTGNLSGASQSVALSSLPAASIAGDTSGVPAVAFRPPEYHVVSGGTGGDQFALDPSATPGSGSYDLQGGLAASRLFADAFTLTMSGSYIYRGYYKTYKNGDRIDGGLALSFRAYDAGGFRLFMFTELTSRYIFRAKDNSKEVSNSGGLYAFWNAGFRLNLPYELGLFVSKEFPVLQLINEPQQKIEGRFNFGVSWNFSLYSHH